MLSTLRTHSTRITLLSALMVAFSMAIASCRAEHVAGPASEATPNVIPVASSPLGAGALAAATDEEAAASDEEESNAAETGPVASARPVISLSAPADGFHFDHTVPPRVPYRGLLGVRGTILVSTTATNNRPQVVFPKAGGMAATVVSDPSCTATPTQCWKFHAVGAQGHPVSAGPAFIGAMGTDVSGISEDTRVTGVVDLCRIGGSDPGETSLDGTQNNRCHEIDGCSVPVNGNLARNDPFAFEQSKLVVPNHAVLSTAFGAGSVPPQEFFPHGHRPAQALPCNNHDVCYQTFGTVKTACDNAMGVEMNAVCARAFPDSAKQFHPLYRRPLTPKEQRQFDRQKSRCYNWAHRWWLGLDTDRARTKFAQRQGEYRPIVS